MLTDLAKASETRRVKSKLFMSLVRKIQKATLCLSLCCVYVTLPNRSQAATQGEEFLTSVTYGVLAGTLVGTATLAFTQNPGSNLQNIARGASLGLYLGIMLGLYVVYIVPNQNSVEDIYVQTPAPRFLLAPSFADSSGELNGVQAQYRVFEF